MISKTRTINLEIKPGFRRPPLKRSTYNFSNFVRQKYTRGSASVVAQALGPIHKRFQGAGGFKPFSNGLNTFILMEGLTRLFSRMVHSERTSGNLFEAYNYACAHEEVEAILTQFKNIYISFLLGLLKTSAEASEKFKQLEATVSKNIKLDQCLIPIPRLKQAIVGRIETSKEAAKRKKAEDAPTEPDDSKKKDQVTEKPEIPTSENGETESAKEKKAKSGKASFNIPLNTGETFPERWQEIVKGKNFNIARTLWIQLRALIFYMEKKTKDDPALAGLKELEMRALTTLKDVMVGQSSFRQKNMQIPREEVELLLNPLVEDLALQMNGFLSANEWVRKLRQKIEEIKQASDPKYVKILSTLTDLQSQVSRTIEESLLNERNLEKATSHLDRILKDIQNTFTDLEE